MFNFFKGFFRKIFGLTFFPLFVAGIFILIIVLTEETKILEKLIGKNVLLTEIIAKKEIIFSIIIFFSFFICYYFSKGVAEQLEKIKKGAEIIGKGNFKHRIVIKTRDEIENLGKTFNQMVEDLEKSHSIVEEAKNVLEIKVQARTKELIELTENLEHRIEEKTREFQARTDELEKFHCLSVNRELKMIELKREIEKLKAKQKASS